MKNLNTSDKMNYRDLQKVRDDNYRAAYKEWLEGLSEEELTKAMKLGVARPHLDNHGSSAPEIDESRISDVWDQHDIHRERDSISDEFIPGRESLQEAVRAIIGELFSSECCNFRVGALCVSLGIRGINADVVADKHSTTKSVVDAEADYWSEMYLCKLNKGERKAMRKVVGELAANPNTRLSLEVMALVTGICYQGLSQTVIAQKHGITRAAVSKRCVEFAEKLGLPPSRAMKSEESRETYAEAQYAYHEKVEESLKK